MNKIIQNKILQISNEHLSITLFKNSDFDNFSYKYLYKIKQNKLMLVSIQNDINNLCNSIYFIKLRHHFLN